MVKQVSKLVLASGLTLMSVAPVVAHHAPVSEAAVKPVTFKAYVVNNRYQMVKNQKITIKDITNKPKTLKTIKTNSKGVAVFSKLPAERSMVVYVNGKNTGYNIRGYAGSQLVNTFYVNKKGSGQYKVKTDKATVTVVNEDAEPIKGQKVELYRDNKLVRTGVTKKDGHVSFIKNITVGTMYTIKVNGHQIPNKMTMSGDNAYVYLTSDMVTK